MGKVVKAIAVIAIAAAIAVYAPQIGLGHWKAESSGGTGRVDRGDALVEAAIVKPSPFGSPIYQLGNVMT